MNSKVYPVTSSCSTGLPQTAPAPRSQSLARRGRPM